MNKIYIFVCFLILSSSIYGQKKDYSEIQFKSKLRNYTKILPDTKALGIDKEMFIELVEILSLDSYTANEKLNFANKLWLAVSNPKKFDFVYKDFSLNTIKNWGVKIKFEDPNFEPNPYLEKWTNTGDEILYFQWAITQILSHIDLMKYGEDGIDAQKSVRELILVKGTKFPNSKKEEFTYNYLTRSTSAVKSMGLVFLIYNNHYDFTVCKTENKDRLIELFAKLKWEFIAL